MKVLTKKEIQHDLTKLVGWTIHGKEIRRNIEFADFAQAIGFVSSVALYAERAQHHPDIDIRWNKISLSLSTHSAGGITEKDISLAREINSLMEMRIA
jgi:4a-hydroxytetrahydrobiopterin dehydratase